MGAGSCLYLAGGSLLDLPLGFSSSSDSTESSTLGAGKEEIRRDFLEGSTGAAARFRLCDLAGVVASRLTTFVDAMPNEASSSAFALFGLVSGCTSS